MKDIIIKNMHNSSDENQFVFSITCSACKEVWTSKPIAFSKAGEVVTSDTKRIVYQAMYQREMEMALLKAVEEARKHFNYCPVCKTLVCNDCFMICDDIDMCVDCATILNEHGELVGSEC